MISRHDTLEQALGAIERHALADATTIVLSREWWIGLPSREQDAYRKRAERVAVELRADDALSSHYVEVRGREDGPALSTEQPL
jgi:hypothetical protein